MSIPTHAILKPREDEDISNLSPEELKNFCTPRVLNVKRLPENNVPKLRCTMASASAIALPTSIDLRPVTAIYNQANCGSCVTHSIIEAFEYLDKNFRGSKLFGYYNARIAQGTPPEEDSGCTLSGAIQCCIKQGIAPDSDWPYDVSKFSEKPNEKSYTEAVAHQILVATQVSNDLLSIKTALNNKLPVCICIQVYQTFQSINTYKTGVVIVPSTNEIAIGGHAILLVGYKDITKQFIFQNSWGGPDSRGLGGWGDKGYGYLPYDYVNKNLTFDPWIIKSVELSDKLLTTTTTVVPKTIVTSTLSYTSIYNNNSMMISMKPILPCEWVNIVFQVPSQSKQTIRMTYRDLYWSYLITNVSLAQSKLTTFSFEYLPSTKVNSNTFTGTT